MKVSASCKKSRLARSRNELAESGHRTVSRVPFFTREARRSITGLGVWRIGSVAKAMRCSTPWLSITTVSQSSPAKRVGHGDDGLQRIALRATGRRRISRPARCAGGIVDQLLDRLGGNAASPVADGDRTRPPSRRDGISITGGTPASSASSSALSTTSLRITSGQSATGWPICFTSSLSDTNSARREMRERLPLQHFLRHRLSSSQFRRHRGC